MNTPDCFYREDTALAIPGVVYEFNFDATTVDIINDGPTAIRYNVRGLPVSISDPKIKSGETYKIPQTAGQRLRISIAADSGTPSFRLTAHR